MSDILMKEGTYLHSILLQEFENSKNDIINIKKCSERILEATYQYNQKIGLNMKKLIAQVKKKQQNLQDESMVLTRYLIETLNQMIKKFNNIIKKVKSQVIAPLDDFIITYAQKNKQTLKQSQEMMTQIQANTSFLKQLSKNFTLDNSYDFTKKEKDQLRKVYQQEMGKCNSRWRDIKKSYRNLLDDLDNNHNNKVIFLSKSQIRFIKALDKFLNSCIISEKIQYIEDSLQENKLYSLSIKQKIRQYLGKSSLFEEESIEDISFKNQGKYEDKEAINDFIEVFTSRYNLKEQEKSHERARTLILEDPLWSTYFLQKFQSHLHTEIRLPIVKYHELTTIMKYLFASLVEQQNNQSQIYNILYIGYRFSNNGNYIIQQIGKYEDYWANTEIWHSLIQYIKSARVQKLSQYPKSIQIISSLWNWNKLYRKKERITQKHIRSEKIINNARDFQVICQINYYMSRLKIKNQSIFTIIASLGNHYGISRQNIQKLFKFHYFNKKNTINKLDMIEVRRKRLQQKSTNLDKITDKSVLCIGKSLKYLQADPWLLTLRLVCKKWAKKLKKKIYKRFLIEQTDANLVAKVRLKIYLTISEVGYSKQVYNRMVKQVPQFTEHTEIIGLDSRRSLTWDESLRGILIEVLRTFSFYHPNVGYLQGMNYLCENILKITDDGYNVYRIFEHLMNSYFFGMYSANFDSLKIKIYQFMRIVSRQIPKLSDHFEAEKIEGQHFLLSWAITLWGQMSGDLCWIMWDGFMVKGWKWWIKTGVWLLKILQPQLLQLNFEGIMKCYSQLSSTIFSYNCQQMNNYGIKTQKIKQQIDSIVIEDQTLKDLENEYNLKVSMLKQYMKKITVAN